jgi:hypothetical protein
VQQKNNIVNHSLCASKMGGKEKKKPPPVEEQGEQVFILVSLPHVTSIHDWLSLTGFFSESTKREKDCLRHSLVGCGVAH